MFTNVYHSTADPSSIFQLPGYPWLPCLRGRSGIDVAIPRSNGVQHGPTKFNEAHEVIASVTVCLSHGLFKELLLKELFLPVSPWLIRKAFPA
jgi:hypothetical protein